MYPRIKLIEDSLRGTIAVLDPDSHLSRWSEEQHSIVTDPTVTARLCPMIGIGETVVDVGASIGDHTVAYAERVGPKGRVIAFEPFLPAFVALTLNCRNLPQVKVYHRALGEVVTERGIELPEDTNFGTCHISNPQFLSRDNVMVMPLDLCSLSACHFIKIDVEGYEPMVIGGAMETIKRFQPIIFVELNDSLLARYGFTKKDVLKPLETLGYRVEFINTSCKLTDEQLDVLMIPPRLQHPELT